MSKNCVKSQTFASWQDRQFFIEKFLQSPAIIWQVENVVQTCKLERKKKKKKTVRNVFTFDFFLFNIVVVNHTFKNVQVEIESKKWNVSHNIWVDMITTYKVSP